MKNKYSVEVLEFKEVHELPNTWTKPDLLNLLETLDYDDAASIADEELREMTALALSDMEPEEAAELVLEQIFGEKLNSGQRKNLSEELKDDRIYEEYSDISCHKELFIVGCMLNWAFPKVFPTTDNVKIKIQVIAQNTESIDNLKEASPAFIARLLNDGMDEHNTIYRLFDENIASNKFSEAEDIIWVIESSDFNENEKSSEITIYTSWNWIDELKGVKSFESSAYADF